METSEDEECYYLDEEDTVNEEVNCENLPNDFVKDNTCMHCFHKQ